MKKSIKTAKMTSREQILAKVKSNQPEARPLPADLQTMVSPSDLIEGFRTVLTNIGGAVITVKSLDEVQSYIEREFKDMKRIISTLPELAALIQPGWKDQAPQEYENVDLAILQAHFGVAENAALWLTETLMHQRVIPFICQTLAVVVNKKDILATMHDAYERIGDDEYGFGAFIAGPSKTADIEQSLVLGAHGPKSMAVFILG
jgi:L-lactate dehydrogenase complex protein LldG